MALFLQSQNLKLLPQEGNLDQSCLDKPKKVGYRVIFMSLMKELDKKQIEYFIERRTDRNYLLLNFTVKHKQKHHIIYRIKLNPNSNNISAQVIFKINNKLKFFSSTQQMLNSFKKILIYNRIGSQSMTFFVVDPNNGSLHVKVQMNTFILNQVEHFVQTLKIIMNQSLAFLNNFSPLLLYGCNELTNYQFYEQLPPQLRSVYFDNSQKNKGYIPKIQELKELLNFTNFDLQSRYNRRYKKDSATICEIQANKMLKQMTLLRRQLQKQQMLFIQPDVCSSFNHFNKEVSFKAFQRLLMYPMQFPNSVQDGIACIYNTISVSHVQEKQQKIISNKERFRLSLLSITYTFPMSQNVGQVASNTQKPKQTFLNHTKSYTKQFFIKAPLNNTQFGKFLKLRWQKQIVSKLRGAKNIYFPRYYNSNQSHFAHKDSIIMDYVPYPTLQDFLLIRHNTISLSTKINLVGHISNAIRFLEDYNIAHLDLSSVNILVVRDNLIKIIDFGQSYSEQIFKKVNGSIKNICGASQMPFKYKPGRTFPFCPPETVTRQKNFTSQQDIYSLGVNVFHMILGHFPLCFSEKLIQMLYKSKSYEQRMFFAPEKLQQYGQNEYMSVLFRLLMKMMSSQEQTQRPFPGWTYLLFKKLQLAIFF